MKWNAVLSETLAVLSLTAVLLCGCAEGTGQSSDSSQEQSGTPEYTEETEASETVSIVNNACSPFFENRKGCAVIREITGDYYSNYYSLYYQGMWEEPASPDSTFKIVSALIGLEEGVITSAVSRLGYDGKDYGREEWNSDVTLKEAFDSSCIWYFRKVIDKVGQEKVKEYLDALSYGNCDISAWNGGGENNGMPELNGFWLESSLQISPKEQTDVMAKIFGNESPFSHKSVSVLKEIMLVKEEEHLKIYGKTGSGPDGGSGWFTGIFETISHTWAFCVRLEGKDGGRVSGGLAKTVAYEIIDTYREVPFQKVKRDEILLENGESLMGSVQEEDFEELYSRRAVHEAAAGEESASAAETQYPPEAGEASDMREEEGVYGGTPCSWITLHKDGRQYFFAQPETPDGKAAGSPVLAGAALTEDSLVLRSGIHTGMNREEALQIYPDLYEFDLSGSDTMPMGIKPFSTGGFPEGWHTQFHSVLMADIVYGGEFPWYLGLFLDEKGVVRAISTCYPAAG